MYEEYLEVALQAARAAGAIQSAGMTTNLVIETKSSFLDLVTQVDKACEAEIARIILENYPDHRLLAEEGTTGGSDARFCWIIDPLDGTTNYAHRHPFFCTSIALEYQGECVVGVVYDPLRDELFHATKGGGAFLNNHPTKVSSVPEISQALLGTGFPGSKGSNPAIIASWEKLALHCHGIRRDGSAALNLCYVSCGRLDGFWESLNAWDMAAAGLIISEAGGQVTNFEGGPFDLYHREILAANNPQVAAGMIELLGKYKES